MRVALMLVPLNVPRSGVVARGEAVIVEATK